MRFDAFDQHVDAQLRDTIALTALMIASDVPFLSMSRTKHLVDLDLVGPEAAEIGQRRIAGAEIVERDAHPHVAQFVDRVASTLSASCISTDSVISISSRDAGNLVSFNTRRTISTTLPRVNWIGREIDRQPHVARPGFGVEQAWRSTHSPSGDDQAGFLGDWHEIARRDHAEDGMAPAHQRLAAADPPFRRG